MSQSNRVITPINQGPAIILRPDPLGNTRAVSIVSIDDREEALAIRYLQRLGISPHQPVSNLSGPLRLIDGGIK